MTALAQRLQPVARELRRNPRLAWGMAVIGAIVLLYVCLALYGWRDSVAASYVDMRERLWRMQPLAGEDVWLQRADEAAALKRALMAQIPQARTLGLAQASAQSWAREVAQASGGGLTVQAQTPAAVETMDGVYRIPVVLSGSMDGNALVQLLRRIETNPNLVTIEQATVYNRRSRTFSLTLVAFYRVESEEAPDA